MASDVDPAAAWVRAIRTAMTDTGTSQRQLGAAVGVSGSAVDQWLQKLTDRVVVRSVRRVGDRFDPKRVRILWRA